MPVLANNRRELFANLLAQGFTAVDAYAKAGFKRHDGNASMLSRRPEIEARVAEIRGLAAATGLPVGTNAIAARAKVTAESLIDEAEQARAGATEAKQFGAVNGAIKNKGILSGVWIERAEIGSPGEFDHLNDDELERLLIERLGALGFVCRSAA
jgi:hypothetical protein